MDVAGMQISEHPTLPSLRQGRWYGGEEQELHDIRECLTHSATAVVALEALYCLATVPGALSAHGATGRAAEAVVAALHGVDAADSQDTTLKLALDLLFLLCDGSGLNATEARMSAIGSGVVPVLSQMMVAENSEISAKSLSALRLIAFSPEERERRAGFQHDDDLEVMAAAMELHVQQVSKRIPWDDAADEPIIVEEIIEPPNVQLQQMYDNGPPPVKRLLDWVGGAPAAKRGRVSTNTH